MKCATASAAILSVFFSAVSWSKVCGDPDLEATRSYLNERISDLPMIDGADPVSLTWDPKTNFLQYTRYLANARSNVTSYWPIDAASYYVEVRDGQYHVLLGCHKDEDRVRRQCIEHSTRDRGRDEYGEPKQGSLRSLIIAAPNKLYGDRIVKALDHLKCLSSEAQKNSGELF